MKQIPVELATVGDRTFANWPFMTQEWRDDEAVQILKAHFPDCLDELPKQIKNIPEYDDTENIRYRWYCYQSGLLLIAFISGNNSPVHDGWIIRFFSGVLPNDEKFLALFDWMKRLHRGIYIDGEGD